MTTRQQLRHGPVRAPRSRVGLVSLVILVLAILLAAWGLWDRHSHLADLRTAADDTAVDDVQLISATHGPPSRTLDLPGTVNAWYAAPIYAQVSGYVQMWFKDYGAAVQRHALLATIDAPGLDEQFETAKANLAVAQARYDLAVVTAHRWSALAGTQAVSQQEVDVQVANATAQKAQVQAAQHEVARYQAMEAFKNVVAPFDGVVTARNTDVGSYVSAAGGDLHSSGGSSELFSVSDIHKLRIYVSVPQDYSAVLKPGLTATLTFSQFPGRSFKAEFLTTANAFNPQTRTVVTELTVDNADHLIWPGTYTDVRFVIPSDPDILIVPEQALLFRDHGLQVAMVRPDSTGPDGTIHLQDVKLGLNLGQTVQVVAGLKPTDRFIDAPSAGLLEGQHVHVVTGVPGVAVKPAPPAADPATARNPHMSTAQRERIEAARGGAPDQ
ncbi:efflux RND transporter periplasmic adaptor subunit [Lichenicoccus roseus]|uniref:Efflux RND transporter periplasmic adaptor subunit n=1 Tax=Lichenicoccus roseus TaxID=2683649 RepID=A0A5R9J997_9PROT|nr:efflux RND transporter periplasmic adaptor subunit [Lichenicoccus roseus]TLU74180.1 efflux RND transporter periplasmic adaptor subunit [Lichenicoccus roseus]